MRLHSSKLGRSGIARCHRQTVSKPSDVQRLKSFNRRNTINESANGLQKIWIMLIEARRTIFRIVGFKASLDETIVPQNMEHSTEHTLKFSPG